MKLAEFDSTDVSLFIKSILEENGNVPALDSFTETLFEPMREEIEKLQKQNSKKSLKHVLQQSALLQKLHERHLLRNDLCYIELGAGKGGLTEKIAEQYTKSTFVIVDRATVRQKKEKDRFRTDIYPLSHICDHHIS